MITIGDDGTVGVAVSVRNNLKTRTSLGPVSILRGEEHLDIVIKDIFFCFYFNKNEFYLLLITYYLLLITYYLLLITYYLLLVYCFRVVVGF
ncbi:Uncharacterised protein [Escherichia coli]|nr:Uncharacterised protein [Escherichia coli]